MIGYCLFTQTNKVLGLNEEPSEAVTSTEILTVICPSCSTVVWIMRIQNYYIFLR